MSTIVNHVHISVNAADILNGKNCLQTAWVTRWNSDVKCVRSVLNCPEEKLAQFKTQQITKLDRSILLNMLEVLEPFEEVTDLTQGDKIVTASFVIPCIRGLRLRLSKYSGRHNMKLVERLLASVNN